MKRLLFVDLYIRKYHISLRPSGAIETLHQVLNLYHLSQWYDDVLALSMIGPKNSLGCVPYT